MCIFRYVVFKNGITIYKKIIKINYVRGIPDYLDKNKHQTKDYWLAVLFFALY